MTQKTAKRLADGWDARMRRIHGEVAACGKANWRHIVTVARWLDANRRDADDWLDAVFTGRPRRWLRWSYFAEDPGAELAPPIKTQEEIDDEQAELRFHAIRAREAWEKSCRRHGYDDPRSVELYRRWVEKAEEAKCHEKKHMK